ncbi:MAG: hypothetical protein IPJ26_13755 [Bacteroidetes bacterium]|nr:hypothetical protein [Bacteroidota bacterium]
MNLSRVETSAPSNKGVSAECWYGCITIIGTGGTKGTIYGNTEPNTVPSKFYAKFSQKSTDYIFSTQKKVKSSPVKTLVSL